VTETGVVTDGSWSSTETNFVSENEVLCYLPAARSYYVLVCLRLSYSIKATKQIMNIPEST